MVRIPEVLDPYASSRLYVRFVLQHFRHNRQCCCRNIFLNYYKSMIWAIYSKLCTQGFAVKYVPDQPLPSKSFTEEKESVQYNITTSNWHADRDLKSFANAKDAAVVIVSSLSDAAAVEQLLNSRAGPVLFILSGSAIPLQKSYLVGLLQWLFIQQEKMMWKFTKPAGVCRCSGQGFCRMKKAGSTVCKTRQSSGDIRTVLLPAFVLCSIAGCVTHFNVLRFEEQGNQQRLPWSQAIVDHRAKVQECDATKA